MKFSSSVGNGLSPARLAGTEEFSASDCSFRYELASVRGVVAEMSRFVGTGGALR